MKHFLAVFTGTPEAVAASGWNALNDTERQQRSEAGVRAWHAWMAQHQAQIVDSGGPLGKTLRVSPAGVAGARNNLSGYVIVRADSHEAAAALFLDHPHFSIFPGDAVDIVACLPTPGA
jgi:hypothetical protein